MSTLPEPVVPASAYDEIYYREWCAGYKEWVESGGRAMAGIYAGFLDKAELVPGEVVVDIGTGRGELLAVAVKQGASHAYGIEYSPDAVRMARHTLAAHEVGEAAEVLLADARSIPLPDHVADLICYVDVVEHLTPDELHASLVEARRILRPGGRVVAHTTPNRLIYDVTYRWMRRASGWRWPADPRNEHERAMHVNEQTLRSLRSSFERAGFVADVELGRWIYTAFVPSRLGRGVYRALSTFPLLAQYGVGDLWAVGRVGPRT